MLNVARFTVRKMDVRIGDILGAGPGAYMEMVCAHEFQTFTGPDERSMQMKGQTALGRIGEPEEVAAVVSFLVSKEASFITGDDLLGAAACSEADQHNSKDNLPLSMVASGLIEVMLGLVHTEFLWNMTHENTYYYILHATNFGS